MAALALHDGRQGVVEADGTLEQRGQVAACKQHVTYHIDTGTTLNRVLIVFSCKAVVSGIMNGRVLFKSTPQSVQNSVSICTQSLSVTD